MSKVKLLEFKGENGAVTFAVPAAGDEIEAVGRGKAVVEQIGKSIGEVFGMVSSLAEGFAEAIKDSPVESAELQFGLQFTAKGTIYVVETEAQGAVQVTLTMLPRPSGKAAGKDD